jgi:branched-chain amino acid transport system substrate-binding protein
MIVAATLMRQYGATREAIHDGLPKARDIPSVVFGSTTFDPATRR